MKHFTGILFLLLLCFSCTPVHDAPLEQALTLAGDNRKELQQVLGHYEGDSLKHKAACFLIENMIVKELSVICFGRVIVVIYNKNPSRT